MTAAEVATRLNGKQASSGWMARCPAHDDTRASLSIGASDDGSVLLHCHAGCTFEKVCASLNLTTAELRPPHSNAGKPQII